MRKLIEYNASRRLGTLESVGIALLVDHQQAFLGAAGFFVGVVLRSVLLGVLLFALGAILFAVRRYLNTGDKAVAGALIFVALVAIGIETIVYFLGP